MRYVALFAAAFAAGLLAAVSQQNVAPSARKVHNAPPGASASSEGIAIPLVPAPVKPAVAAAPAPVAGPVTAKQVAAEAKPAHAVRRAEAKLKKTKPKAEPAVVAAPSPPPEPERPGFFRRLFGKSGDRDQVAAADAQS